MASNVEVSINEVCRLCLGQESLDNIFDDHNIHRWIMDYLAIKVSQEDRISRAICTVCRLRLTEFHQFRIHCQEIQTKIMARVNEGTVSVPDVSTALHQNLKDHVSITQGGKNSVNEMTVKTEPQEQIDLESQELNFFAEGGQSENIVSQQNPSQRELISHDVVQNRPTYNDRVTEDAKLTEDMMDIEQTKIESYPDGEVASSDQPLSISTNNMEDLCIKAIADTSTDNYGCADMFLCVEMETTNSCLDAFNDDEPVQEENNSDDDDDQDWESDTKKKPSSKRTRKNKPKPKTLECVICEKSFRSRFQLDKHHTIHNSAEERARIRQAGIEREPVECNICKKVFHRKYNMYAHRKKVHGPKVLECLICGYRSSNRQQQNQHYKCHSTDKETMNSNENSIPAYLEGNPSTDDVPKECAICEKLFPSQYNLWIHQKHAHKTKHQCSLCDAVFQIKDQLKNHMCEEHNQKYGSYQPSFRCKVCDITFETAIELKQHRETHKELDGNHLQCKVCNIVCETTVEFKEHKRTHVSHSCVICNETFKSKYYFKKHLKTHSEDDNVQRKPIGKQHRCHICGKKYSALLCFLKHKKTHVDALSSNIEKENEADRNLDDAAVEATKNDRKLKGHPQSKVKRRSLRVHDRNSVQGH